MAEHPRMLLNNWLQGRYGTTKYLTWDAVQVGTEHSGYWVVTAYFNNIEYGRGTGITKGDAANSAAEQTLIALRGY